jgi:hypothetical protein
MVEERLGRVFHDFNFRVPTASPLKTKSCCDLTLLSCEFGDDISEQSGEQMDR